MIFISGTSKRFLLSYILISSAAFCYPALAKQLTPNITLDTNIRIQASDVDNADLGTEGSKNVEAGALEARFRLTGNLNENMLFFWEGRGVANVGRRGFQSADT
ncbi:MAG: hypothetical protein KAH96_02830, partial [Alphaproteobacteria bacterium]|nr:hypothetical protein [Alphaproteobacteria bacterium]